MICPIVNVFAKWRICSSCFSTNTVSAHICARIAHLFSGEEERI
jgi:hypothetical protein